MSYRKTFVPIVLLVVASLVLATGMNASPGLAKPDPTKVPLPIEETVTPEPSSTDAEDWPGPWFEHNSLAGVDYYKRDNSDALPDMTPDLFGKRGWNIVVVNNAINECNGGLDYALGPALEAQVDGLVNIVRIDYKQENGQSIAVPRYTQHEDYGEWIKAFAECVYRFRNYSPPYGKKGEVYDLAQIFIVGNEPDRDGGVSADEYLLAFNELWDAKYKEFPPNPNTELLVAGPSAFNTGVDPIKWMAEVTQGLKGTDGFAIHTYGIRVGCTDPQQPCKWDGGGWRYDGGFRFYRDLIGEGINSAWWEKPAYITEFNTSTGDEPPEKNYLNGWIQKAFSDVRDYNATRGNKPVIKALSWFVDDASGRWDAYSLNRGRDPSNIRLHLAFKDMQTEFHNPANRGLLAAAIDETGSTIPLRMSPGETRRVTVRVLNMGPTTWRAEENAGAESNAAYGLAATSNNQVILSNPDCKSTQNGAVTVFEVCHDVPFLGLYEFSFDVTMPAASSGRAKLELQMALSTPIDGDPRNYLFWFGEVQAWEIAKSISINDTVSAYSRQTCAVVEGVLKCWGSNTVGELGNGTNVSNYTPTSVVNMSEDVIDVAAGLGHTCAVTISGVAKCWGANWFGQLGSVNTGSYVPIDVDTLGNQVADIGAGMNHTCALTKAGGVKCWGRNEYGQLGNGTHTNSFTPVGVSGLENNVVAIDVGSTHNCALTSSGDVKCWGYNYYGQLGNGVVSFDSPVPVNVIGLSDVVSVVTGGYHSCALREDGTVMCWGTHTANGTNSNSTVPVPIQNLDDAVNISTHGGHTCVLSTSGGVKCWGSNIYGQLGNNSNINSTIPVDVSGLSTGVIDVAGGFYHACAKLADGSLKCWGDNNFGQLGTGNTVGSWIPVNVVGMP